MSTELLSQYRFDLILESYPKAKTLWIAYSGGLDSSVLLHLIYCQQDKIKKNLQVVYVNHNLQTDSLKWGEACKTQCERYGFSFLQIDISETPPEGCSIEAWAREKRYALIAEAMAQDDLLLTAHHQDDQVETFFLQALRGGGPRGLASMPEAKAFVKGVHLRPLLSFSRDELLAYANEHALNWHEDPSNQDINYHRNYLRRNVLPEVEKQWPAYRKTVNRLVEHQQDTKELLDELAQEDLKKALYKDELNLSLDIVKKLSAARQKNLILFWLRQRQLATPDAKHLEHIIADVIYASDDSVPCVNWGNIEFRRYRNLLYAEERGEQDKTQCEYEWDIMSSLDIMGETLIAKPDIGSGLSREKTEKTKIVIRYRQGGEKINPDRQTHSKSVKQIFQEKGVLPWQRKQYPLVYVDDSLALIPGLCVDKAYAAKADEPSWKVIWSGYEKAVQR